MMKSDKSCLMNPKQEAHLFNNVGHSSQRALSLGGTSLVAPAPTQIVLTDPKTLRTPTCCKVPSSLFHTPAFFSIIPAASCSPPALPIYPPLIDISLLKQQKNSHEQLVQATLELLCQNRQMVGLEVVFAFFVFQVRGGVAKAK